MTLDEIIGRFLYSKEASFLMKKKQIPVKVDKAEAQLKDFFDMVAPSAVKFMADHYFGIKSTGKLVDDADGDTAIQKWIIPD